MGAVICPDGACMIISCVHWKVFVVVVRRRGRLECEVAGRAHIRVGCFVGLGGDRYEHVEAAA
jgi:hypothetical protein